MKKILIPIVITLFHSLTWSQAIESNLSVLATAGTSFSNGNLELSYTLGEVAVKEYLIPGFEYQEGFQTGANREFSQNILLNTGWNLISFNVQPTNDSVAAIFSSIENNLLEVKDDALVYNPALPPAFNTLKRLETTKGYWVKVTAPVELEITGQYIDPTTLTIDLSIGWNLVAYLNRQAQSTTTTANLIGAPLQEIKDATGVFIPSLGPPFNTLLFLEPGSGYWIKVNAATSFSYQL